MRRVVDLLRAWDTDGDGYISRPEFIQAMRQLGMGECPTAALEGLWVSFDTDNSGQVCVLCPHTLRCYASPSSVCSYSKRAASPSIICISLTHR